MDFTRFETTRLLSARALQLAYNAPPLIKVMKDSSPYDVARAELEKSVLPITVMREKEFSIFNLVELEKPKEAKEEKVKKEEVAEAKGSEEKSKIKKKPFMQKKEKK